MQDKIIKGRDNPISVVFSFSGEFATSGLNNFTRIDVKVGDETYTSDTDRVDIVNANELRISVGDITSLSKGRYMLNIIGFNATYDDGFLLTGECKQVLPPVTVC